MSARSGRAGRQSTQLEITFQKASTERLIFGRCLRDLEAGAAALNLDPDGVHLAVEIAAFEPNLDDEQRIALILLLVISLAALEEGSTRFPVTGAQSVEPMSRMLDALCGESFGADGAERMRANINGILTSGTAGRVIGSGPGEYKPLIYLPPYLYQHRILSTEIGLARRLASMIRGPHAAPVDEEKIHKLLLDTSSRSATAGAKRIDLSEEQRLAIVCAATNPLTIVSGGPGTGKTSIVVAILKLLVSAGVSPKEIALTAPTGKAAYRIGESIRDSLAGNPDDSAWSGTEPTTVHRLLGYSPTRRRFRYHKNNPLEAKVVIVDEGSMLDLELIASLVAAFRPDARLIILGDADQLPSVAAGAVFRDLMPTGDGDRSSLSRSCMRLTRSYRTDKEEPVGKTIFNLASAINAGNADAFAFEPGANHVKIARRESAEQLEFEGVEWVEEEAPSGEFLERWYATYIRGDAVAADLKDRIFTASEDGFAPSEVGSLRHLFDHIARSRILSVTRIFESGSERINFQLHRRAAHDRKDPFDRGGFMIGEPVMVLRNDYQRLLFNGDQGVVLQVRRGDARSPMAVFPKGSNFVAFPVEALKDHLELCYATTVHKAQGSEFDSVAVVMPKKDLPILTREILYTAVSRARRSVTILGGADTIRSGISRRMERYSGVREQLERNLIEMQRA